MNILSIAQQLAPRIFSIRKGTWITIGIGTLVLIAAFIWAGISILSWLFGQAPGVTENGKRAASVILGQAEQAIPGVREKIELLAPSMKQQIEDVAPGVREQVAVWLPNAAKMDTVAHDVSGTDFGPVTRFPGLARENFQRDESGMTVRYLGRTDFQSVLTHYARGFESAGYRQDILSATRDAEHHRYTKGADQFELRVTAKPRGEIQAELKSQL